MVLNNNSWRVSAGNSDSSASTVSFNVSTAHAIARFRDGYSAGRGSNVRIEVDPPI